MATIEVSAWGGESNRRPETRSIVTRIRPPSACQIFSYASRAVAKLSDWARNVSRTADAVVAVPDSMGRGPLAHAHENTVKTSRLAVERFKLNLEWDLLIGRRCADDRSPHCRLIRILGS